ncbi:MAG: hypothetical protein IPP25_10740 [Saprospiraceae bacterium]|nr:hypothetical protein [Candidatus Opimibacter skivensis]
MTGYSGYRFSNTRRADSICLLSTLAMIWIRPSPYLLIFQVVGDPSVHQGSDLGFFGDLGISMRNSHEQQCQGQK